MCGAAHGPAHDDPAAATLCDRYHALGREDVARLARSLDERQRELLWLVAVGLGPDAVARRTGTDLGPDGVRAEMAHLAEALEALGP